MNLTTIKNKSGKVKLTEDINQFSVEKLTEDIGKLFGASAYASGADFGEITNCAENAIETLEIEINSPGGSIFDGYTIYQEIKSLQERGVYVTATVTGMAASMASVICMACNEVRMVPHGRMMIHEASQGVRGNAEELRKAADLLDGLSQNIAEIYAGKTGKDVENIREMMKQETWMTATQSLEHGFIDSILDIQSASPKNTQYINNPMSILSKLFPGNDEVSKLEASIAENEYIRTELEIAQNKIQELSGLSAIILELEESKAKAEASLVEAQASIIAKDAEIEEVKASIPSAIAESLAAIGQPAAIEEASAEIDHIKELSNLKGSARTAYYNANQAEIKKQLKK
jgi:ATP-dependent Clp endopeptidase proteolytic subunit ClpP